MTIPYEKYHGTGNDFLLVDAAESTAAIDWGGTAVRECDRETGVGADGILVLELAPDRSPPRVGMTLYQPDGGTAAMCGNGARCAAEWAMRRTDADEVVVETGAGDRRAERTGDGVAVEMGVPSFDPADVPLTDRSEPMLAEGVEGLSVTAVDTGVPHAVAFADGVDRVDDGADALEAGRAVDEADVEAIDPDADGIDADADDAEAAGADAPLDVDDIDAVDLETVAPPVRHAGAFPEGANVTLASRVDGSGGESESSDGDVDKSDAESTEPTFRQRTFERGVEGETDACGTGAVAVAAAARRLGRADGDAFTVRPPGGRLRVRFAQDGRAFLIGPVEREFAGELEAASRPGAS